MVPFALKILTIWYFFNGFQWYFFMVPSLLILLMEYFFPKIINESTNVTPKRRISDSVHKIGQFLKRLEFLIRQIMYFEFIFAEKSSKLSNYATNWAINCEILMVPYAIMSKIPNGNHKWS